jgi:hypothetical protein
MQYMTYSLWLNKEQIPALVLEPKRAHEIF